MNDAGSQVINSIALDSGSAAAERFDGDQLIFESESHATIGPSQQSECDLVSTVRRADDAAVDTAAHTPTKPSLHRGTIALGAVLLLEAVASPLVWWGTFIFGTFVSVGEDPSTNPWWLDVMDRVGNWGALVLVAVLISAAVVVLTQSSKHSRLSSALCLAAGLLNTLPAISLVVYNTVLSSGPIAPRLVGIAFGALFGFVCVGLLIEGIGFLPGANAGGERARDER